MANQTLVTSLLAHYSSKRYKASDAIGDLCDVILRHSNKKYFIYHTLIKEVCKILKNNNNSFIVKLIKPLMNFYLVICNQI